MIPWGPPATLRLPRQADHRTLGRGVRRVGGQPEHPGGGRHHDPAIAPFDQVGPRGAGRVERTTHMHRQVPGEVVCVCLREPGPPDDAGVVDHDVEVPELLERRTDERRCAGLGCHVAGVGEGNPARGHDLGGHAGGRPGVRSGAVHRPAEVVDDDASPPLRQQQRIGAADATAGAGDDGSAPFEAELAQAATEVSNPSSRPKVPPTSAARSSVGRSPSSCAISSRLPRNVPSACG